jgi:hypothetical protein
MINVVYKLQFSALPCQTKLIIWGAKLYYNSGISQPNFNP